MAYLKHYGVARRSGRYPWGSGEDPEQRNRSFLGEVKELEKKGLKEVEIAKGLGTTTTAIRKEKSLVKNEKRSADLALANRLREKGVSNVQIGKRLGRNESYVRSLFKDTVTTRLQTTENTTNILRDAVTSKNYVDIGAGVERYLGVSRNTIEKGIEKLKKEGFIVHKTKVQQLGTGKFTNLLVLTQPGTTFGDVMRNRDKIKMPNDYSEDGGYTFNSMQPIKSVNGSRIKIRYGGEGGELKDGVIELRRGVDDISLGNSKYSQVRIGVNDTHYMKGMAIYSDDIPKGYDIIYNTNKPKGTPPDKVYKPMEKDPENPFGSTVRQKHYIDSKGQKQLSVLNIVNDEGDWGNWSKSISSQVLSKQPVALAKKQLDIAYDIKKEEFDMINSLTNVTIKKKLLETFAEDADSASVHLKAAALPRQASQVILPFPNMKETEIYAPNFNNGERVVLIRHPHGGIFEIPELVVNNKHPEAKRIIGNAKDGVGINPKVAEILSGADFDGDSVLVIPNNKREIKTSPPLEGLKNFDPKVAYKGYEGMDVMGPKTKAMQMGLVSNLISDMSVKKASQEEIAAAVRHSMVVIDAEKHKLNYKQSYLDNGVAKLKIKYQGSSKSGASTLISRASSEQRVYDRRTTIDKATGKKIYTPTNRTYKTVDGTKQLKTIKSTKMAEIDDARKLSSGTEIENVYADHANRLKSLANESRRIATNLPLLQTNKRATEVYKNEVDVLNSKLNIALKSNPLERRAQLIANSIYKTRLVDKKDMIDEDGKKKLKYQSLAIARSNTNPTGKQLIDITPKEWEAIQSGAISNNKLKMILDNSDIDKVKQLAMPRTKNELSPAKLNKAKLLLNNGYTQAEVAYQLSISTSELNDLI